MTSIKILFSYNNSEKVVETPVVPNELPEILNELSNQEFGTHTTTVTLLGNKKPRSFSMELFLPTKSYDFAKDTGLEILDLLKYVAERKIPMRIVIIDDLTELLNIAVSIQSYKYKYDTVGDIRCSVEFKEYIFINTTAVSDSIEKTAAPSFTQTAVTYKDKTTEIKSLNVEGHFLVKARDVLSLLGKSVDWNAECKRVIADGKLLDIHTEIFDGSAYCYVRDIAAETGVEVEYNAEDKSIKIKE